uniref:G_PROTEIN_RECEP_F1_2 domain-containing protein n=1 Tax=Panagrellus redivivus TaxID=6233 RepID=A0A7E4ZZZ5_PANRE
MAFNFNMAYLLGDFRHPRHAPLAQTNATITKESIVSTSSTISVPSTSTTEPFLAIDNSTDILAGVPDLCLGLSDVFVALFLILLIFTTIFGNILVVLSVFLYKRMRTFTNILLTSLATADLFVGVIVMPLALIDLLYRHNWPFGRMLCRIWATVDVLLCTASILNLCIISFDRYMAITSPLKYSRTRSRCLALSLLSCAWGIAIIVCSPPWFVQEWGLFTSSNKDNLKNSTFVCVYSPSIPYRIYSASGSFYIPLLIMLSMYFKIFQVASERERTMRQSLGTCRLSRRIDKQQKRNILKNTNHNRNSKMCLYHMQANTNSCDMNIASYSANHELISPQNSSSINNLNSNGNVRFGVERESKSLVDLSSPLRWEEAPVRKNTEVDMGTATSTAIVAQNKRTMPLPPPNTRLHAAHLMNKMQTGHYNSQTHYNANYGQAGKSIRGSKEKIVYLRERKALKTIGIVVLGFISCWMPFFVMYLIEVFVVSVSDSYVFKLLNEFFLWLGYSNSVLNPIIYTMYNGDFRRCFRDLLGFGCCQHHRRSMSVKKLHQQSTVF